jgi:hypothetical protein
MVASLPSGDRPRLIGEIEGPLAEKAQPLRPPSRDHAEHPPRARTTPSHPFGVVIASGDRDVMVRA